MIQDLTAAYGKTFENELINEIVQVGTFKEVPEGFKLMEIGDFVRGMPLLISGVIKILREDEDGDELLLYYLEKGDTCSMTMACCMGDNKSEIRAIAETDTKLIMVPIQKMEEWTTKYKSWRNFVFNSYHERLNELLNTLDNIAFQKMDERLIGYLKEKARVTKDDIIHSTHQEIAYDLHSSRVVISRLLKKLEEMGKIKLHRNYLKILDL
ncbi:MULTISPECIES: Crp/Fnr family transcriptional regulator [Maribacter]|uniref:CRP/FNR family transcriptional regulator, anaerobic regulatory protein n=1 Tax=Maribacter dokdonensis TaxID=320912 RepID=A0A1H4TXZ0_9FLAO|nr:MULTISPECIES: Crp/Fnr family transcriptional regulator [Maribacter]HAF77036.1 Crp/Fnr family transcriptional regulator [Maribacter sp.]APA63087.1 Crp/Fnr family transcriptional regulator [Maribacter sp. 1_2014MBL_MicDiv]MBU2902215.1 Crp/Fnr family transcriptional regulator [Maribacter dokdonensis]MDP2524961.1 Crp/Fnr family transcriptional regulator [Maribacter dokdonensis]PHN92703.1 Crp/Fnr family transcriptional regulator [Maribacter sp. 6B07]|tara:strand:+ start:152 stop:784 length:633 start_codon:yes stop_codon:yes gene_type:complete